MAAPAWLIGLAAAEAALRTPVMDEPWLFVHRLQYKVHPFCKKSSTDVSIERSGRIHAEHGKNDQLTETDNTGWPQTWKTWNTQGFL